jgi:hypothetical protein
MPKTKHYRREPRLDAGLPASDIQRMSTGGRIFVTTTTTPSGVPGGRAR